MPNLEKVAQTCRNKNFEPSRAVEILHKLFSRYYCQTASTDADINSSDSEIHLNPEDEIAVKLVSKKYRLFRG